MADDSLAPPPQGGGSAKYLIALLLLLGGGLGVYFAMRAPEAPPPPPPPPVKSVDRNTALSNDTLEIPDEVPDAGATPVAAAPTTTKKTGRNTGGDTWECAGDVAPKDITKVLNESQSAIRSCYERQLRNDNQLQGNLKLQVRIGNDGAVAATRVAGTLNDKEVRSCIQAIAKRWSFPTPEGGSCAVFDAPYNFMPKN